MCLRPLQEVEDDGDEGGELDEEDLSCLDEDLLAAAADLLPALAASMGPAAYAPVFASTHAEPLLGRLKPQQPLGLRAIAAGAAAEVAEVLGAHMGGVVAQALPLLLRELQADDDINRQNAAYCTGLLVQASPEQAGPFLRSHRTMRRVHQEHLDMPKKKNPPVLPGGLARSDSGLRLVRAARHDQKLCCRPTP